MRLSEPDAECIRAGVLSRFGEKSAVWLFGSRVRDDLRGGDIDLYIEPEIQDSARIVDAKLALLVDLHKRLGERKIDIVIRREAGGMELPIHKIARDTGIRLA